MKKAIKIHSTMTDNDFILANDNIEKLEIAFKLFLKVVDNNNDDNCQELTDYIANNDIIYVDDTTDIIDYSDFEIIKTYSERF